MKRLIVLSYFICLQVFSFSEPVPALIAGLAEKSLLLDIKKIGKNKLIAVGDRGHVLLSQDGLDWHQTQVPIQAMLTSVFFVDDKNGWIVGHDGSILNSNDGGETWIIQQYLPELEKPLLDVIFKNKMTGIAVGAYGQFYRTSDGGQSWVYEFHDELLSLDDKEYLQQLKSEDEEAYLDERSGTLPHFNRILIDGENLYLVGEMGLLARSSDFGFTWVRDDAIYQGSFFDIKRSLSGSILVAGLRGNVFKRSGNDTPWVNVNTGTNALINSIVLGDDNRLFLLGNNGLLLESNDDGQSYITHKQAHTGAYISGVWFNNQIVVVSDAGIQSIKVTK